MKILLIGMSHRTAPLALRERLAVDDPVPLLRKLVGSDEIDEAVLLSTCNRIELVVLTRNLDAARLRLRSCFRFDLPGILLKRWNQDGREAIGALDLAPGVTHVRSHTRSADLALGRDAVVFVWLTHVLVPALACT